MFNTGLLSSQALSNIVSFGQDILVIGNGMASAQYLLLAIAPRLRNLFILYLSLSMFPWSCIIRFRSVLLGLGVACSCCSLLFHVSKFLEKIPQSLIVVIVVDLIRDCDRLHRLRGLRGWW